MHAPRRIRPFQVSLVATVATLLATLAVACGSAAGPAPPATVHPTPQPNVTEAVIEIEKIVEVEKTVPKEVVETQVEKEVEKLVVVVTPTPAPEDPRALVRRDQLTILTSSFGNEIYNSRYISGDKGIWWYPMQERMINADRNLQLTDKGIVVKWELTDDNLGWEYTIRDDAQFHNGDPVTPEDIAFSFQWGFHEEATSLVRQRMAKIIDQHAHVTGPNTVKLVFTQPHTALPGYTSSQVASGGSSGIVHQKSYFDEYGVEGYEANPNPASAGPFNQIDHQRGAEVAYEKWGDHFRKDRVYAFDKMSIRLVAEQSTQVAALNAGAADIIPADLTVLDQIRDAGGRIVFSPESTVIWINANSCSVDQPPQAGGAGAGLDLEGRPLMCSDKRVRHALDYAIDKSLIQAFFGGPEVFEIKGTAAVSPSGLGYGPGLDPFPYDPDKARELLAEAGYPNGEGFNYGEPFNIWTWPAGATAPRIIELADLVCGMWKKELNFECKVNVGDEVSIKKKQSSGSIPGQYLIRSNEHDYDVGSKYKGRFATPTGSYISYDPIIETVVNRGLSVVDPTAQSDAYYKMHQVVHGAHWDFAPGYLNAPYGVSNKIVEWEPWPLKVHPTALWTIRFAE